MKTDDTSIATHGREETRNCGGRAVRDATRGLYAYISTVSRIPLTHEVAQG